MIGRAQSSERLPIFTPPLDIPLSLSGNFMELRSDHFHSGIDIRTDNREGLPVKAAGDGWVSRIKVSPWGYGKALYIDHPNGYTTVYGHLRNYTGTIADAVLDAQYKAEHFDVDITFNPNELPVKAGDIIANSGNSGASGGPHLHFEVRTTKNEHALDPELFGMVIPDTIPPIITGVRIDPLDSEARVPPYPAKAKGYPVQGHSGVYILRNSDVLTAFGTVGVSVNVIDRYSNSPSACGIRSLKVSVDGEAVFSATLDEVDFGVQRYADAFMDYALFKGEDMYYNRCYRLPNNRLALYGKEKAQGRITVEPGKDHAVLVEATDAHGQRSTLAFALRGASADDAKDWPAPKASGQLFRYDRTNTLAQDGIRFVLPPNALFADARMKIATSTMKRSASANVPLPVAPIFHLGDPLVPLLLAGQLALRVDPIAPIDKLLLVKLDDAGVPSPIGGTYSNGWLTANVKSFGDYTVMIDTVAPKILAVGLKPNMTGSDSLKFRVGDDLSGIDTWSGQLDGHWMLLEYDPKKRMLYHVFDKHSDHPGEHELVVEVADGRGNRSTADAVFSR